MIYRIRARPAWNRKSTTKRFFGSGYVGFLLIAMILLVSNGTQGAMVLLAITLLAGMGQVLIIFEEVMFYRHLNKEDPLYYQYNRTRTLLQEHFAKVKKVQDLFTGTLCFGSATFSYYVYSQWTGRLGCCHFSSSDRWSTSK